MSLVGQSEQVKEKWVRVTGAQFQINHSGIFHVFFWNAFQITKTTFYSQLYLQHQLQSVLQSFLLFSRLFPFIFTREDTFLFFIKLFYVFYPTMCKKCGMEHNIKGKTVQLNFLVKTMQPFVVVLIVFGWNKK